MAERKRIGKPKKPLPLEESRKCVGCGKTLPVGVRFCVACGTHDETDLDTRVADIDRQVERRRERAYWHWLLYRMTFGLWRL